MKVQPPPGLFSTHISPLCLSIISLTIANPKPVPSLRVVKKGWKIFDFISSGIPLPESQTEIVTTF